MYYQYTIREQNNHNIATKYTGKPNNYSSRDSEEQYNNAKLQIWHVLREKTSKGSTQIFSLTVTHHDLFKDSPVIPFQKSLVPLAKTEKSPKDTTL